MTEADFLKSAHVMVWGLGLMGGSLALALKDKCARVIGVDPDPKVVKIAIEMEITAEAYLSPTEYADRADVFVLAAPVRGILGQLRELSAGRCEAGIVLDLGSTKRQIVAAMEDLPEGWDPVGGHPMCGSEKSSIAHATANIYQKAAFALVETRRTSSWAKKVCELLVHEVGAEPLWLDAENHDLWAAATSSLSFLAANALAATVPTEARILVGPGFQSTSRLAVEPIDMVMDILRTNGDNVLSMVKAYRQRMLELETALESHNEIEIRNLLLEGARQRHVLLGDESQGGKRCG